MLRGWGWGGSDGTAGLDSPGEHRGRRGGRSPLYRGQKKGESVCLSCMCVCVASTTHNDSTPHHHHHLHHPCSQCHGCQLKPPLAGDNPLSPHVNLLKVKVKATALLHVRGTNNPVNGGPVLGRGTGSGFRPFDVAELGEWTQEA